MRAGEIIDLEWNRIHKRYLVLRTSKTGVERNVPLSARALELLQRCKGIDDEKVFIVSSQSRDAIFRKARECAGLSGFTFHDARHTAATRLASLVRDKKIDVFQFCKIFGWSDINRALTYVNPTAEDISELIDAK